MKLCTKCNVEKELSSFSKNKNSKDGLQYYCRSCMKVARQKSLSTTSAERAEKRRLRQELKSAEKQKKQEQKLAKKAKKLQARLDANEKTCSRCKESKSLDNFFNDKTKWDGLRTVCKACCSSYYFSKRKDVMKEYNKKYREQNKEKIAAFQKEYRKRPEVIRRIEKRKTDPKWQQKRKEYYEKRKTDPEWQQKQKEYRAEKYESSNRDKLYQQRYGITVEEYEEMLESQNHSCAICGTTDSGRRRFAIDHDHETGKVRGLLCDKCNMFVGHSQDDDELMRKFVAYLEKPPRFKADKRLPSASPRPASIVLRENKLASKNIGEPAQKCIDCNRELPLSSFSKTTKTASGYYSRCKICHSCRTRNITYQDYETLLEEQGGTCATCGGSFDKARRTGEDREYVATTRRIDHCHDTGAVRGLLCHNCNCALGFAGDSVETITAGINYLALYDKD